MFILDPNKGLIQLQQTPPDSEDFLQELLAEHPALLGNDGRFRLLLIKREMGVPDLVTGKSRWSLDHLYVDQDGVPTLVETKRASNSQVRREVVGQMLDYAANAVEYWSVETIRSAFASNCTRKGLDEMAALRNCFGDEVDPAELWNQVSINLQAGRIRLLFVADEIPPELRAIVEFMNEQMNPAEVLAIEVGQFTGAGVRALVPTTFGDTRKARGVKALTSDADLPNDWDEALDWVENEDIKPLVRAEAGAHRNNPRIRKIYYDFQGQRRWRIQVQKRDLNIWQSGRFKDDVEFWSGAFPMLR